MPYILEVGGSTLRKVGASVTIECLAPLLNGCQDVPLIPTHKVLATRMLEAAKDILLKLFGALAPWLLGLIYKPEWISTRVKIRVTSDGEGVRVQGGELPDLQIWMQVTNLSPFSIEIDRVVAQVQLVGGVLGEFTYLVRQLQGAQLPDGSADLDPQRALRQLCPGRRPRMTLGPRDPLLIGSMTTRESLIRRSWQSGLS